MPKKVFIKIDLPKPYEEMTPEERSAWAKDIWARMKAKLFAAEDERSAPNTG